MTVDEFWRAETLDSANRAIGSLFQVFSIVSGVHRSHIWANEVQIWMRHAECNADQAIEFARKIR